MVKLFGRTTTDGYLGFHQRLRLDPQPPVRPTHHGVDCNSGCRWYESSHPPFFFSAKSRHDGFTHQLGRIVADGRIFAINSGSFRDRQCPSRSKRQATKAFHRNQPGSIANSRQSSLKLSREATLGFTVSRIDAPPTAFFAWYFRMAADLLQTNESRQFWVGRPSLPPLSPLWQIQCRLPTPMSERSSGTLHDIMPRYLACPVSATMTGAFC